MSVQHRFVDKSDIITYREVPPQEQREGERERERERERESAREREREKERERAREEKDGEREPKRECESARETEGPNACCNIKTSPQKQRIAEPTHLDLNTPKEIVYILKVVAN